MLSHILQGRPLRHPLHPILIHFPIGLFVLSLVMDFLSLALDEGGVYLQGSLYMMSAGVVTALLAAVPGLADFWAVRRDSRARRIGRLHLTLNLAGLGVYGLNLWFRWVLWGDDHPLSSERVEALGFLLSLVGLGLVSLAAYLGGRLVYGHGVSVGRHRREAPLPRRTLRASSQGSPDGFVRVAGQEDLPEGGTLRAEVDGRVMAILRAREQYFALQDFCTHRFGPLSEGRVVQGQIECPWHRSEFDVKTGEVTTGPAKVDLRIYEVRLKEGDIQVRVQAPSDARVPAGESPSAASDPEVELG